MKKINLFLICFFIIIPCYCETIVLKNGKTIEGTITERNNTGIKLNSSGSTLTFFLDEIASIDGKILDTIAAQTPQNTPQYSEPANMSSELESWYTSVKVYLKNIGQIINKADIASRPIIAKMETSADKREKMRLCSTLQNTLEPILNRVQELVPPNGLENWHKRQVQAISISRNIANALANDDLKQAKKFIGELDAYDEAAELEKILIQKKIPQEKIIELRNGYVTTPQ